MIRAFAPFALLVLPLAATAQTPPKPGVLKTFGDWVVGCDNSRACAMRSLAPNDAAIDEAATTMLIERAPGAAGAFRVTIEAADGKPRAIGVDGVRIASGRTVHDGDVAQRVVTAMAQGQALQIGPGPSAVTLKGVAAALRYIDAEQGRAGGVTAAVAKGAAPATRVPAAAPLPVVVARTPGGPAAKPTAAQVAAMRKTAECDLEGFAGDATPELHALGGGDTLVLVPCMAGAYNVTAAAFVLRGGKVLPARADVETGFGENGGLAAPANLVNADFGRGVVTSFAKGRGVGDCGNASSFVWDGNRLRLVEASEMSECRGNTGLIPTWRATVRRR